MAKKKSKAFIIVTIVLIVLVVFASVFAVKNGIEYAQHQYKLSTHPLNYSDLVEKYASENNLDKYFVYSIVKTESSFRPDSVSNVGARGLMQIMEETFDWVKSKIGDGDEVTYDDMFDPETNIRYGSYLIGYLLRYFDNDETCAIAAYHAGIGSVESWLENKKYSLDGKTLEEIPTDDTNHYVNKINNAYNIYIELYETEK